VLSDLEYFVAGLIGCSSLGLRHSSDIFIASISAVNTGVELSKRCTCPYNICGI